MSKEEWYSDSRAEHLCCWGYGVWSKSAEGKQDDLIAECNEENVNILAAANDMYQALVDTLLDNGVLEDSGQGLRADTLDIIEAALAKADGENNDSK